MMNPEQLQITVQFALQAARNTSPEIELVRAADQSEEVAGIRAWLAATPEPLRSDARAIAAPRLTGLLGGHNEFWMLYLELEPSVAGVAAPAETPATPVRRKRRLTAQEDPATPRPSDRANLVRYGKGKGIMTAVPIEERTRRMAELAPLVHRLLGSGQTREDIVASLNGVGLDVYPASITAIESAASGDHAFYVPRESVIEAIGTGLKLLVEELEDQERTTTIMAAFAAPDHEPEPEPTPPRGTDEKEGAEHAPEQPAPRNVTMAPSTRKERLRYIERAFEERRELSINTLSRELGLKSVGTVSELMSHVEGARHVGNGVWRRSS